MTTIVYSGYLWEDLTKIIDPFWILSGGVALVPLSLVLFRKWSLLDKYAASQAKPVAISVLEETGDESLAKQLFDEECSKHYNDQRVLLFLGTTIFGMLGLLGIIFSLSNL